jgi:hypothetical protein
VFGCHYCFYLNIVTKANLPWGNFFYDRQSLKNEI